MGASHAQITPDAIAKAQTAPKVLRPWYFGSRRIVLVTSFVYILWSIFANIYYLLLLYPSFSNDMWWAYYNITGYEAYLIDVINQNLVTLDGNENIDLLQPSMAIHKTYSQPFSTTEIYPTYVRRLAYIKLTSIEFAITNLREMSPDKIIWLPTPLCWVDFNRTFELAQTYLRQKRCNTFYTNNGAVYLESAMRNSDIESFLTTYGGRGNLFTIGIQDALEKFPAGLTWLQITASAYSSTTISSEMDYWRSCNITHYQMQWTNDRDPSVAESVVVENALGMTLTIALKNQPTRIGPWTSIALSNYLAGDLTFARNSNRSLIRSASNYVGISYRFEDVLGFCDANGIYVNQTLLFRTNIGPFLAVDAIYVQIPRFLINFNKKLSESIFNQEILSEQIAAELSTSSSLVISPIPPTWGNSSDRLYYGGNPLCMFKQGTSYVQSMLSYDDTCQSQSPFVLSIRPIAILFAVSLTSALNISASCSLSTTYARHCKSYLSFAAESLTASNLSTIPPLKPLTQVEQLNISLFQFATNADGTNWTILLHPIVDRASPFAFFGYAMLYEWLIGAREVISLQGDVSTIVLISESYDSVPYGTSGGSHYIKSATEVVFYVTAYAGVILVAAAFVCLALGLIDMRPSVNLIFFNRVAGSTWVGRSLLFLRGMSALLVMSTANIQLVSVGHSWSRFVLNQRHWFDMAILASEGTWVTYVLNELLILFFPNLTPSYAPWSSASAWLIMFVLQATAPVGVLASIGSNCQASELSVDLHCTSGTIEIGQSSRLLELLLVHVGVLALWITLAKIYIRQTHKPSMDHSPCVVSGIASTFIEWELSSKHEVDRIACFMSGLVPIQSGTKQYIFDINLWVVTENTSAQCRLNLNSQQLTDAIVNINQPTSSFIKVSQSPWRRYFDVALKLISLIYLALSTVGSMSYLSVSQINIANDLAWATFNSTGIHAYVATYFNSALLTGALTPSLNLASPSINIVGAFGMNTSNLHIPGNVGTRYQLDRITSLVQTIKGLRDMNACDTPLIFSPYCYLDFNATWSIAHSQARVERCTKMTSNGAIFLESVLRNIDPNIWKECWGIAFDIAYGNAVRLSNSGREWLSATFHERKISIDDEATYWKIFGIGKFLPQWQNFKSIGVINTYRIQNAWGISYPFTLVTTNGTYRSQRQTSFKLYWGLANDLQWISSNLTNADGGSLVRNSANYVFANDSFEAALVKNGTVPSPLGPGFAAVRSEFGPFGTIDTHLVAVPKELRSIVADIFAEVQITLRRSKSASTAYTSMAVHYDALAAPQPWINLNFITYGGSPLCEAVPPGAGTSIRSSMSTLFSFDYGCYSTEYATPLQMFPDIVLFAYIMTRNSLNSNATCSLDPSNTRVCLNAIETAKAFTNSYLNLTYLAPEMAIAFTTIKQMDIRLLQYGIEPLKSTQMNLYTINLLEDSTFYYYAWAFLYHWVLGDHNVVTFEGDEGAFTLMSEYIYPNLQDVQSYEVPTTLASYARSCNMYITYAMIAVTFIVLFYFILSRGHVEGRNLFKLNRVGALNWIGRPLIFVRSLTAIALLSTGAMELSYSNGISYLNQTKDPWYTIVLASSEVTWLVEVVNDIALAVTQTYTPYYATLNTWSVWAITGLLSVLYPVTPMTVVNPQCEIAQVDFQLVCHTATIAIGQPKRLVTLIVIVLSCNALMYIATRLLIKTKPTAKVDSLFLAAGAKYLYSHDRWIYDNIYYLDQASAMLNGLLTLRTQHEIIALDIKFWRVFHVPLSQSQHIPKHFTLSQAAAYAIPLVILEPPSTTQ